MLFYIKRMSLVLKFISLRRFLLLIKMVMAKSQMSEVNLVNPALQLNYSYF